MLRGLVKGRITSYRNAVNCIQGKLEMKRLGQIHRIRKGYPGKAREKESSIVLMLLRAQVFW